MYEDRRALAALLLVLQAGLSLLAALGLLGFARLSNATRAMLLPETLAISGPMLLLLLALGLIKNWRVGRPAIVTWEVITLLGGGFSILASAGASASLTLVLTGLALPAAVLALTLKPRPVTYDVRTALTAGLLLLTGIIHLALVPEHRGTTPRLAILFALDGCLFVALGLATLRSRWWRRPAAALLVATILAYLAVVASGRESVDDLGIATKSIELAALGLVVWPRAARLDRRFAAAVAGLLLSIVASGTVAWAASLRPNQVGHAHAGQVGLSTAPATDEQRAAAAKLVEDTRAGTERYAELSVAVQDGYRPSTPAGAPTVHYVNAAYQHDGLVLDPQRPEALVYATTPRGSLLLGAMYMLPKTNAAPPDLGGSVVEWHTHSNLCFSVPGFAIDGLESPFGTCPIGSINGPTPALLHVWTVPNPGGPFADLSPAYVARLTR